MRQKSGKLKEPAEKVVKNIRRATRKRHSSEEKIRIVLEGLRGRGVAGGSGAIIVFRPCLAPEPPNPRRPKARSRPENFGVTAFP